MTRDKKHSHLRKCTKIWTKFRCFRFSLMLDKRHYLSGGLYAAKSQFIFWSTAMTGWTQVGCLCLPIKSKFSHSKKNPRRRCCRTQRTKEFNLASKMANWRRLSTLLRVMLSVGLRLGSITASLCSGRLRVWWWRRDQKNWDQFCKSKKDLNLTHLQTKLFFSRNQQLFYCLSPFMNLPAKSCSSMRCLTSCPAETRNGHYCTLFWAGVSKAVTAPRPCIFRACQALVKLQPLWK